jgi:hypothetical protein
MTINKHLKIAKSTIELRDNINIFFSNHVKNKTEKEIHDYLILINTFDEIRSMLDEDYHSRINKEIFEKYGHIYYK